MQKVSFEKGSQKLVGAVISRGWFRVDGEESFEVKVESLPYVRFIVPVSECKDVQK